MRARVARISIVIAACAVAAGVAYWVLGDPSAATATAPIPRRDMFAGILALGALALAFFGLDLGDRI